MDRTASFTFNKACLSFVKCPSVVAPRLHVPSSPLLHFLSSTSPISSLGTALSPITLSPSLSLSHFELIWGSCCERLYSGLRHKHKQPNWPKTSSLSSKSGLGLGPVDPLEMATDGWNRTALLVIDMQADFIQDGGPMHVKGGKDIVPNVIKAVELARQRGILIVWVVREHDVLGRDVELFRRHLYTAEKVGPTSKGSAGAELVDGLVIKEGDYKLVKTRFSAFFATHLHSVLQGAGINSLVITGVQTPNCIRQTVYDAVALDYQPVTVIFDATAAATPDIHLANVCDMKNIGVATPTLQEWSESKA